MVGCYPYITTAAAVAVSAPLGLLSPYIIPVATAAASVPLGLYSPYIIPAAVTAALALLLALIFYMHREACRPVLERVRLTEDNSGSVAAAAAASASAAATTSSSESVSAAAESESASAAATTSSSESAPASSSALRIVQLSDIHISTACAPPAKIIQMIRGAAPDIIVLTGDYIESEKDLEHFIAWIGELVDALGQASFYLCYGNHDYRAFKRSPTLKNTFTKMLKRLGIFVLEDRTLLYSHGGKRYAITGFADRSYPAHSVRKALTGIPKDAAFNIGITHNPDLALELNGPRPDLLLCGHFHGGQIRLPFHLEYTCLRKEYMCKIGIRSGLHNYGGRSIYISRGLGCAAVPLRLGAAPEITLLLV